MNISTYRERAILLALNNSKGFADSSKIILEELKTICRLASSYVLLTGSRKLLSHTEESDYDLVIYSAIFKKDSLFALGYTEYGNSSAYCSGESHFIVKKHLSNGKYLNLIFVNSQDVFNRWAVATGLAERIQLDLGVLLTKQLRGMLFSTIIDGKYV